nr:hypothetical protein [Sphingopyxis sp. PET50]
MRSATSRAARRLDQRAHLVQVADGDILRLQRDARRALDHLVIGRTDARAAPRPARHGDQPFGFENADGLANRRARYLELGDQVRFSRKRVPVDQLAADDGIADLLRDKFRGLGNTYGRGIAAIADRYCNESVRQV